MARTTAHPVDPDVKMPAAVLAAMQRSEELMRQAAEGMVVTPEGNPETPEGQEGVPNPDTDAASLAAAPEQEPASQPPAEPQQPAEEDEDLAHKYKSAQGRLSKMQKQIDQLLEDNEGLRSVIASMQLAPTQAKTSVPELEVDPLTDDEMRDYGEDFMKVVGKRAKAELAPVVAPLLEQIEQLKAQLSGVTGHVQLSAQEKLHKTLDEKLTNWRQVNTDERFIEWLRLPDPFSGAIRHDMLKAAYTQGNAPRVLAFFNGFLAEEAATAPATQEPDTSRTTVPRVPLADLAAPGRAKTAAPVTAPAEKPSFTRAQIAAFYADVAAGRYRGQDERKNALEAQIFQATREGRVS